MDEKRIALYVRAEAEEAVKEQENRLRKYAKAHPDWEIRKSFVDKGPDHKKRLALQALDAEIKEGRYDIVLTVSMDRLSRKIGSAMKLLSAWRDCGTAVTMTIC